MKDYSIQNKRAWEYNAYEFWVKHIGAPSEREYLFQCWNDMTDGFYHDINYHFGEIEIVTG